MEKKRFRTLREVSKELKISLLKVNKLRDILKYYYGIPEFMIHGTNGYKWSLRAFKFAQKLTVQN